MIEAISTIVALLLAAFYVVAIPLLAIAMILTPIMPICWLIGFVTDPRINKR
jgi:uncharacterized membrane protein